jgi:hypothetical protein
MKPTTNSEHAEAVLAAQKLIERYRGRDFTEQDVIDDLTGLAEGVPAWRGELLAILAVANGIPFNILLGEIGVGPAVVMARRRRDKVLDDAVKNYLGSFFEDEASVPSRDIKAGVLVLGLEQHAHGWKKDEGRTLSDEDLHRIIRAIIDSVRLRVGDPKVLKDIGEDIQATLARFQGGGSGEAGPSLAR